MADRERVLKGLEWAINDIEENGNINHAGQYLTEIKDALELLKEQDEIIDALLKVGYPHNFQREPPWIVNYMYSITDVVRKAVHLRNEEVKQDEQNSDLQRSTNIP